MKREGGRRGRKKKVACSRVADEEGGDVVGFDSPPFAALCLCREPSSKPSFMAGTARFSVWFHRILIPLPPCLFSSFS